MIGSNKNICYVNSISVSEEFISSDSISVSGEVLLLLLVYVSAIGSIFLLLENSFSSRAVLFNNIML
jgi:hypothetical protein